MLITTIAWRGYTGVSLGSYIEVHVVTVIVAITQVRIAMVHIRATPHIRITVVQVIGAHFNCKVTKRVVTYRMVVALLVFLSLIHI